MEIERWPLEGQNYAYVAKMESFVKTPLISANTMFEIDLVIIIPQNGNFSDN